jgi:LPS-assembly lipoprotein
MRIALLAITLLLSSCGFELRGHGLKKISFSFHSIYVRAPSESPMVTALKQKIKAYKLELAPSSDKADLTLDLASESMAKQIVALNSSGQVSEYEAQYHVSFRVYDRQQQDWIPASEISLIRDYNYDNSQLLAMTQQEQMIYQDIYQDAAQQLMFRLSLVKPPQPDSQN